MLRPLYRALLACLTPALLAACTLGAGMNRPAQGIGAAAAPARLALVIGNAQYETVAALRNPANDAQDICATLQAMRFRTLCHTNVRDRAEFDRRVREYVALLGPETIGVVYYSGHGVQARGANFLIPTQAQVGSATDDPTRVLYGLQELFERLREQRARLQFVVLDACRSDLFGASSTATRSVLVRSLETTARATGGMAQIADAPPATAVLYATAAGGAAYDGRDRNGPMTQVLLRHLRVTGLKLKDLIDVVTKDVQADTKRDYGRAMTPFSYGSYDGEVCLGGCLLPPVSVVPN
jgi:uncharacterized caspase-like protein